MDSAASTRRSRWPMFSTHCPKVSVDEEFLRFNRNDDNCRERHTCRQSRRIWVDPPYKQAPASPLWSQKRVTPRAREKLLFSTRWINLDGSIQRHNWSQTASKRLRKSDVVLCASFTLICGLHPARRLAEQAVRWESIISPFAERTAHVSRLYMTYGVYLPSRSATS